MHTVYDNHYLLLLSQRIRTLRKHGRDMKILDFLTPHADVQWVEEVVEEVTGRAWLGESLATLGLYCYSSPLTLSKVAPL